MAEATLGGNNGPKHFFEHKGTRYPIGFATYTVLDEYSLELYNLAAQALKGVLDLYPEEKRAEEIAKLRAEWEDGKFNYDSDHGQKQLTTKVGARILMEKMMGMGMVEMAARFGDALPELEEKILEALRDSFPFLGNGDGANNGDVAESKKNAARS
jgi:hypothetical protein